MSFVVVHFCIFGEKLKFVAYDVGLFGVPFGVRDCFAWIEILDGSLSTLRTALSWSCFRGKLSLDSGLLAFTCLEILDISASKLLLLKNVLCPAVISEAVQSRKGLIYDTSSVDLGYKLKDISGLFMLKYLSKQMPYIPSLVIWISWIFSASFLYDYWLCLSSSSRKTNPSVTISNGP